MGLSLHPAGHRFVSLMSRLLTLTAYLMVAGHPFAGWVQLIWTPDASRGLGLLGNAPDAYGQTWHLPIDPDRLTYAQMIDIASEVTGRRIRSTTVPESLFKLAGRFNPAVKEAAELLPRYRDDNIFDSSKFATRFPNLEPTSYRNGITQILTT